MKNALRLSIAMLVVASSCPQVSKKLFDGGGGSGTPCPPGAVCWFDQTSQ